MILLKVSHLYQILNSEYAKQKKVNNKKVNRTTFENGPKNSLNIKIYKCVSTRDQVQIYNLFIY